MLIENDKMILDNSYFSQIVDSLNCMNSLQNRVENMLTWLTILCQNSKLTLPSIVKIKKHFKIKVTFSFSPISKNEIVAKNLQNLQTFITSGGEIPLNILKKSNFTFDELTECVNYTLKNGKFPDSLKNANITPHHKKDDPTDKVNYRPVSALPLR